jgi:hypothetical protein
MFVLAVSMNARSVGEHVCELGPAPFARLVVAYESVSALANASPTP